MMRFFELQSILEEIENNSLLFEEKNFLQRTEIIDVIEFQLVHQIERLQREKPQSDAANLLAYRTENILSALESIDDNVVRMLRENIKEGYAGKKFKHLISNYFDFTLYHSQQQDEIGYDNLDVFINRLFPVQSIPEPTIDREPEMVCYQKTPARIVFELVENFEFAPEDVFFDVGSGLGLVAILVHLLTGIRTIGVEVEPSFCEYARQCATELRLAGVSFINADARKADYSEGTVFFMFTPFKGKIFQEVMAALRKQSQQRKITIMTYGHCTADVASQNWLARATAPRDDIYTLAIFTSLHD